MSFTVDLQDTIIMAELNRVVLEKQLSQLEPAAEVRYDFCKVLQTWNSLQQHLHDPLSTMSIFGRLLKTFFLLGTNVDSTLRAFL